MPSRQEPGKSPGTQTREELERARQEAQQYASAAAEHGREGVERAKEGAAERVEELAEAIDETADRLAADDDALGGAGHSMASMMRRFAGGLRERDVEDFARQLAEFARRNPATFLAGSVALGFGLSRFLKASSRRAHAQHHQGRFEDDDYFNDDLYQDDLDEYELGGTEDAAAGTGASTSSGASADERWPQDTGGERPGAASPTSHQTPAAQPASEDPLGAKSAPAGGSSDEERRSKDFNPGGDGS